MAQMTKRCWNCHTYLALNITRCTYCGSKVLEVNEHGIAKKPFDWKSYVLSFLSILVFCLFIWWAFIKKGA